MGKYKVYVYAICKNEEKFAARWMESMKEADGVCVLDTGSQDGSAARLRQLGARVEEAAIVPWRFDDARNRSLAMVPPDADICVCTDLDEVFSPGWRQALEEAWQPDTRQARYPYVWSFRPDGREETSFYSEKIHARQGVRWVYPVHEVLRFDEGAPRTVTAEGVRLCHYPDPAKSRAQYLPLLELAVREDPQNDRNMHYLGREYLFRGQYAQCVETLEKHLRLPSAVWRDERCASCRYLARAHAALGDPVSQECCLLRALAEAPWLREPWVDFARLAYARHDWPGALFACRRALAIRQRPRTYITEAACWGALPWDLLSIACWNLGLKEEAKTAVREALRLEPEDERLQSNLALMEKSAG